MEGYIAGLALGAVILLVAALGSSGLANVRVKITSLSFAARTGGLAVRWISDTNGMLPIAHLGSRAVTLALALLGWRGLTRSCALVACLACLTLLAVCTNGRLLGLAHMKFQIASLATVTLLVRVATSMALGLTCISVQVAYLIRGTVCRFLAVARLSSTDGILGITLLTRGAILVLGAAFRSSRFTLAEGLVAVLSRLTLSIRLTVDRARRLTKVMLSVALLILATLAIGVADIRAGMLALPSLLVANLVVAAVLAGLTEVCISHTKAELLVADLAPRTVLVLGAAYTRTSLALLVVASLNVRAVTIVLTWDH